MSFCKQCGNELSAEAQFCGSCGAQTGQAVVSSGAVPNAVQHPVNTTLPKAINVVTILMIIFGAIGALYSLWMLSSSGQEFYARNLSQAMPGVSAEAMTSSLVLTLISAVTTVVLGIVIRKLKSWAYYGAIALYVVSILQYFSPLTAQLAQQMPQSAQVSASSGSGLIAPIVFLIVFGLNYKSYMEAAQHAAANRY